MIILPPFSAGLIYQMNKLAKKNSRPENARPGFPGEKHPPLRTTKGLTKGNFLGPGTDILARLARGDMPINFSDTVAKAHDLRYSLAENKNDIRRADLQMISKMKEGRKKKQDFRFNLILGQKGIEAKVGLEKLGLPATAFTSFGGQKDPKKIAILRSNLKALELRGFGAGAPPKKPPTPWMVHVQKVRAANPGVPYKRILQMASKTYVRPE